MRVALLSKSDTQVLTSICDSGVTFAYKHKVEQINDTNNISMVIHTHHIKRQACSKYIFARLQHTLSSVNKHNGLLITHYVVVGNRNENNCISWHEAIITR